jgi:hypothetical protein
VGRRAIVPIHHLMWLRLLVPVLAALVLRESDWLVLASCAAGVVAIAAGAPGDVAVWRRLVGLFGPATTLVAVSLPWWNATASGWRSPGGWVLAGFALLIAAATLGASREGARAVCLGCGLALVTLAGWDVMLGSLDGVLPPGPQLAIAGGLVTTIAGLVLYPPRRSASSLITAS